MDLLIDIEDTDEINFWMLKDEQIDKDLDGDIELFSLEKTADEGIIYLNFAK